jgi:hypothetical protein
MTPTRIQAPDSIQDWGHFPGPDELDKHLTILAERHPNLVRRTRVGASRHGTPITMTSIGSGPRDALVLGGPHPNEPVGFVTTLALAELLCQDRELRDGLGYTWHLIACIDPDGARLNEGWYCAPTRRRYHRYFFRPQFDEDVEWDFPTEPGRRPQLPETRALTKVIDTICPILVCSLHNSETGGMHHLLNQDRPGIVDELTAASTRSGLPITVDDISGDIPGAVRIDREVFALPATVCISTRGEPRRRIACSLHYAARHGALGLTTEVPLWPDARAMDTTPCGERRTEVFGQAADRLAEISPRVGDLLDRLNLRAEGDAARIARSLRHLREVSRRQADWYRERAARAGEAVATVAERWTAQSLIRTLRGRTCGTALRMLDESTPSATHTLVRAGLADLFEAWAEEAEASSPETMTSPRRLAAAQLDAIIATARYLKGA